MELELVRATLPSPGESIEEGTKRGASSLGTSMSY